MTKHLIYFLAFFIFVLGLATIAYSKYTLRSDEGLVYLGVFKPKAELLEFEKIITLSRPSTCRSSKAHFKGLPITPVKKFIEANKDGASPIRISRLEGNVPIVSWEDTKGMHQKGTTFAFHPENKRLLYLSRVGFNNERTNAILCIEISENSYGQGILFFLEKKGNKWEVKKNITIWVS